jgi:hypothetical protein
MLLIPYECLIVETHLSPEEVHRKLTSIVEPRRSRRWFWPFWSEHRPYQGRVSRDEFRIIRIIHYRNSFLPIVKGRIQQEVDGSYVHITMHPHIVVLAFMTFWLGAFGYMCLNLVADIIISTLWPDLTEPVFPSALLGIGGMFMFGYVLLMGAFKFESIKSKSFFREMLEESDPLAGSPEHECKCFGMTNTQITIIIALAILCSVVLFVVWKLIYPSLEKIVQALGG